MSNLIENCFEEIKDVVGDNENLLREVLEIFINTSRRDVLKLYDALEARNTTKVISISHKLCSTYGYFSKAGVSQVMSKIESSLSENQSLKNVEVLLSQIYPVIRRLDTDVYNYLYRQEEILSKRILIIEDDKMISKVIQLNLEKQNYTVDIALNGLDGLELVSQNIYDIVITDMNMPYVSGKDVIKYIDEKLSYKTKVIAISVSNLASEVQKNNWNNENNYQFMLKPLSPNNLVLTVNSMLNEAI